VDRDGSNAAGPASWLLAGAAANAAPDAALHPRSAGARALAAVAGAGAAPSGLTASDVAWLQVDGVERDALAVAMARLAAAAYARTGATTEATAAAAQEAALLAQLPVASPAAATLAAPRATAPSAAAAPDRYRQKSLALLQRAVGAGVPDDPALALRRASLLDHLLDRIGAASLALGTPRPNGALLNERYAWTPLCPHAGAPASRAHPVRAAVRCRRLQRVRDFRLRAPAPGGL